MPKTRDTDGSVNVNLLQHPVGSFETQKDCVRTELSLGYYLASVKLFEKGDYLGASSLLRKAISHNPELYEAHYFLGMIQGCLDDYVEATRHLREAVRIKHNSAPAHLLLGKANNSLEFHQDAIFHLRRALELDPDSVSTACTLASALASAGYPVEGVHVLESFTDIGSKDPLWHFTMAMFTQTIHPHLAMVHYREALNLKPEYHEAGLNYAVLLLSFGMYETGWEAYEHRIPWLGLNPELGQIPRWHGEPLTGKAILVATEQGFGDSIQFIRYAQYLKEGGARVYVLCSNNLPVRPLMEWAVGVDSTIIPNEPVPHIDWYVPLMSLPGILGTTLETVPAPKKYIIPDEIKVKLWQERLKTYHGLKVGLVWCGNRALPANRYRSIPFDEFSVVLEVDGVTFFTLQIGTDALCAETMNTGPYPVIDLTSYIHDFGDTAAYIANLDLVISVDTATAHLAGALGKPVWTLLYHPAEWRWMRERDDTPWYPSMRLFRQNSTMQWSPVLERVKKKLVDCACNAHTKSADTTSIL